MPDLFTQEAYDAPVRRVWWHSWADPDHPVILEVLKETEDHLWCRRIGGHPFTICRDQVNEYSEDELSS